jgi:hypothetical protein
MRHRGHISEKDRQNRSRLAKLVHNRRLLMGSLVTMTRTCGNPRCKCARGKKHVSLYLSVRTGNKRKMIYIPPKWEKTICSWVETYQEMKQLTDEISKASLDRFFREKKTTSQQ